MKFGIVVFPGSNCDQDCHGVIQDVLGEEAVYLWHQQTGLQGCDAVILPGGFSYGDYLRTGAIARFSPIMKSVAAFAQHDGGLVLGICNGMQILLEAGLLPGAIIRNQGLRFICRYVHLRVERAGTPFTNRFQPGQVVRMPIAHNDGNYTADAPTRQAIRANGQAVFRYCDADGRVTPEANPNGSTEAIAGLCNAAGNVMGMMPHPERAAEPQLGSMDGRLVFESMLHALAGAGAPFARRRRVLRLTPELSANSPQNPRRRGRR